MSKRSDKFYSISSKIKFVSGILSWVILVILVIIAMFLLYYFVAAKIYAQKGEQYKPAFALYTILSPSMVPNIKVYDVIVDVNVKSPTDIKEGDIITFISTSSMTKGMTITHRVVKVNEENGEFSYVTKGDANLSPAPSAAPYNSVQGKVLFHIPQLGRVQEFLGTQGGWLLVVVLPALYVIISDIFKIVRLKTVKEEVNSYENKVSMENEREIEEKNDVKNRLLERYNVERQDDLSPKEEIEMELPKAISNEDVLQSSTSGSLLENETISEENQFEDFEDEEEPEIIVVHGEELVKPKRKRKRKRKRKHHHNDSGESA